MADDIVDRLRAWADMFRGGYAQKLTRDAAAEIERLRAQLEFAHNILGSETMVWLFHGSDGWKQSNIDHLREPVHVYWQRYGNVFKEANRG